MTAAADDLNYRPIIDNIELVRLHEFGLILNSTHNIDKIVKESAKAIRQILDTDGCHIALVERIRNELHLATAVHDGVKPFPQDVDETKGVCGETVKSGTVIIVDDAEHDPRVIKEMVQWFSHKSILSAPIVVKGDIIGAIVIYSMLANKFTKRDGEFLLMLGNHLGLALENARLMHELHLAAFTDSLTGAFNRGYFHDELDQLLTGHPTELVSLIMMDVNDLKVINDTYGHTMGDFVLQELTAVLQRNVRARDIVSRYGGDEFAIILPGTDTEEAMQVAERIQVAVGEAPFSRGDKQVAVSVAWGTITTRGQDMPNMDQIIDAADSKLYNMKKIKGNPNPRKKNIADNQQLDR